MIKSFVDIVRNKNAENQENRKELKKIITSKY